VTPYYEDEWVQLWHGDMREVLRLDGPLAGLLPALILTDPPYGDTSLEWDRWVPSWPAYLPPSRQLWCFGSMRMWLDHAAEFAEWTYGQEIVWEKHNGSSFHADRFKRVHELPIHWYRGPWGHLTINPQMTADATARTVRRKTRPAHTGHIDASAYESHDGGPRLMRSVIYARSMHGRAIHPTEKPTALLEHLIRYSTNPGDLILDPFAGSCSTARAARATGRRAVCIEANEQYLQLAVDALAQEVLAL
jgi:site-specific DNA-methyltransferase (adenine-specific)